MSVTKIIELIGSSSVSFDDAIKTTINKAGKTVRGIKTAKILGKKLKIKDNKIVEYMVKMKVAFDVE